MIRGIIKIYYYCNSFCVFCHSDFNKVYASNFDKSIQKIEEGISLGIQQILFSGGEPTIYPKFKDLILYISQNTKIRSGIISNARKLSDDSFTIFLLENRVEYYYISLHANNPIIHDSITDSPNSWQEAILGLKNLIRLSKAMSITIDLTINCVVIHKNLEEPIQMIKRMVELGISKIKFSYPQYKGKMTEDTAFDEMPYMEDVAQRIEQAIVLATQYNIECFYDGLPYCKISPQYRHLFNNLQTNHIFYMTEIYEEQWFSTDQGKREKYDICKQCSYNNICEGIYVHSRYKVIEPIIEAVPSHNCFYPSTIDSDLESASKIIVWQENDTCLEYISTQCSNFEAPYYYSIDGGIDLTSLYFLDKIGTKDGKEQYKKTNRCVLDIEDSKWDRLFSNISGNVLDVGCGKILFADYLFSNSIHYIGLENNLAEYNTIKSTFPNQKIYNTSIEHFIFEESFFDFILLLGSYNHIENLRNVLDKIKILLKPEGKLIIIENNYYNLLLDNIVPIEYQHYRNHSLEDAIATLEKHQWKIQNEKLWDDSVFWQIEATKY